MAYKTSEYFRLGALKQRENRRMYTIRDAR